MSYATPYCYKASGAEDYNCLAEYIVTSTLNASFFPKIFTIVVTHKEEDDEAFKEIGKFLNDEGLNFHISPIILHDDCRNELIDCEVTPSHILQTIIYEMLSESVKNAEVANSLQTRLSACEDELTKTRIDKDRYHQWWQEASNKNTRLENSIKALSTLLNSVVE